MQFGFGKMYWKLVFIRGLMQFFGVKFLVCNYDSVNFVKFRKSSMIMLTDFLFALTFPMGKCEPLTVLRGIVSPLGVPFAKSLINVHLNNKHNLNT